MKILVTGSCGFIGSHLSSKLIDLGNEVIGLDNMNDIPNKLYLNEKERNLSNLIKKDNFRFHKLDLLNYSEIEKLFSKYEFDRIAHIAAIPGVRYSIGRSSLYNRNNVESTINILECSLKHGLKHVVIASSSSVYGNDSQIPLKEDYVCAKPLAPYAASKRSCELFSHSFYKCHNLPITCLRFFSVYGPNGRHDMMPFKVMDYIVNSKPIRLFGNGELKRDWTFIEDIVDGIILSLGKPLDFEIFNLGFGVSTSMNDFVRIIEDLSGRKAIIEMAERPFSEPEETFADIIKTRELLSYNPKIDLKAGLKLTWKWFNNRES